MNDARRADVKHGAGPEGPRDRQRAEGLSMREIWESGIWHCGHRVHRARLARRRHLIPAEPTRAARASFFAHRAIIRQ